MKVQSNANRTLEDLEKDVWPDPGETTQMIKECHRLRKLPIHTLTDAQLGLLIRQRIGGQHLINEAIPRLEANPLLEASTGVGDLLWSVLQADDDRFRRWPRIHQRLVAIAEAALASLTKVPGDEYVHNQLRTELSKYVG